MPSLHKAALQFRADLLERDSRAARELATLYLGAARRIRQQILQLALRMQEARAAGETISPSWLYRQQRLATLLLQVQNELAGFNALASTTVASLQRELASLGLRHSADLFAIATEGAGLSGGFAKLPSQAAGALAGFAGDGSPVAELFARLAPGAAASVKQALFSGIVRGVGAEAVAKEVFQSLGGNMARSLLIARNESLRAYRESSQQFYEANNDVIDGWRWVAACNTRTCPVCWAMHGSEHSVKEQFVSHPGCRCTPAPITDSTPAVQSGPLRFAALSKPQQLQVLGPLKFAAYEGNQITLRDLVGTMSSRRWGMSLRERSLSDALADPRGEKLPKLPTRSATPRRRVA